MAPNGNYYTQFWSSLPGERDNYLSCGECFEVIRTRGDGSEYEVGDDGYTYELTIPPTVRWYCVLTSSLVQSAHHWHDCGFVPL